MFIPDPGFEFFHPGSRAKKILDPDPHQVFLTQKPRDFQGPGLKIMCLQVSYEKKIIIFLQP
jgi:hypothetical protein